MKPDSLPLKSSVGAASANFQDDVTIVQATLSVLKKRTGNAPFYSGRIDRYAGDKTIQAIREFQSEKGEQTTGSIQPGSPLHRRLDDALKLFFQSLPRTPIPHLTFNGKQLCWVSQPYNGKCWNAVSGRPGYQSKEHQGTIDHGPIPEGRWLERQDRYQRFSDLSLYDQLKGYVGRGPWPGRTNSWGEHRVWLEPKPGTNTRGRTDLSIHGGTVPGSAGCVDLTHDMSDFTKHFREFGVDMELVVRY